MRFASNSLLSAALALCTTVAFGCGADDDQLLEPRESTDPEVFLREIAREEPPPEYEFIGYVKLEGESTWIHELPPEGNVREVLEAHGIDVSDPAQGVTLPRGLEDTDAGRGVMVSADGRLFLEREDAFLARLQRIAQMPESMDFGSNGQGTDGFDQEVHRRGLFSPQTSKDGIHGSDQRLPVVTSSYPYRAVGQQVLKKTGSDQESIWVPGGSWARTGSSGSIGPRAVLTAAHVIANPAGDLSVSAVAPAARGFSWPGGDADPGPLGANGKFPHGIRRVSWYAWPLGAFDGGMRNDYAVLTLYDQPRGPGWVRFGFQGTSWLNFKSGWNNYAYPGATHSCANSFDGDGKCGGYMYHVTGETRGAYTDYVEHWLDNQPGHSGSPMYISKNDDRVIYLIEVMSCDDPRDCGAAKRLRAGSTNTICRWVEARPSEFFPNVSC